MIGKFPNDIKDLGPLPAVGLSESTRRPSEGAKQADSTDAGTASIVVTPKADLSKAFANWRVDIAESFIAQFGSIASQRTMRQALERCARLLGMPYEGLPWHELRFEQTSFIRGRLLEPGRYERATAASTLAALRGVLTHAYNLQRISAEDLKRATTWQKLPKWEGKLRGREITQPEIDKLRAYWGAQDGAYGLFLAATFGLLMGAGLRASELCRMAVGAYDGDRKVHVLRKGGKKETLPLGRVEKEALDAWLPARRSFRLVKSDALVLRVQKNDWVRPQSAELNVKALEYLCEALAEEVEIPRFTPHDLRRTFATRMRRAGVDIRVVQWLMSHESPDTTARYDMGKLEEFARLRWDVNLWDALPSDEKKGEEKKDETT
jgi:integrase/recombinase XerD